MPSSRISWSRFAGQVLRDSRLWMAALLVLGAFRFVLIGAFHSRLGPRATFAEMLAAASNGFRFDAQMALIWVGVPLAFSLLCAFGDWTRAAGRVRAVVAFLFLAVTVLLDAITLGFMREFDDQFNHFILGVVRDDFWAILKTIGKEYPLVLLLPGMALIVVALFIPIKRFVSRPWISEPVLERLPRASKILLSILLVPLLWYVGRGSLGRRPLQEKDIGVTADSFLNKTILNPYKALYFAVDSYRMLAKSNGIRFLLPDGDIRAALRRVFPGAPATPAPANLDDYLKRTARGAATAPRHVIVVVMESYNGWPLLAQYRSLGIAGEMERLGGSGLLWMDFLSTGDGTMDSLGPLVSGLAESDIPINYQPTSREPYPTAIAAIFRRLGYRTRFFYAGYPSWQRMGEFAKDQGFDEVYGGGDVGNWAEGNEWGVSDENLFDFVLRKMDDDAPTFDMVLTVSNHPPFDVDVVAKGFPLREIPEPLRGSWDGSYTLEQIGHFWYADRCLGRFADAAEGKLPKVLLAVTGDHYSRRFLNGRPGLVERALVPLLLHGPEVLKGRSLPDPAFGSQLDIPATLVELAAPAGFVYHALGRDLLEAPGRVAAFGARKAIGRDFVAEFTREPAWAPLPGAPDPATPPDLVALKRQYKDLKAITWWRVVRGPGID